MGSSPNPQSNSYANGPQYNSTIGNAVLSGNRIRESSSGALVGKNIAGITQTNMGKSSSNILTDDKIILNKINNEAKPKFVTHENNSGSKS